MKRIEDFTKEEQALFRSYAIDYMSEWRVDDYGTVLWEDLTDGRKEFLIDRAIRSWLKSKDENFSLHAVCWAVMSWQKEVLDGTFSLDDILEKAFDFI